MLSKILTCVVVSKIQKGFIPTKKVQCQSYKQNNNILIIPIKYYDTPYYAKLRYV